MRVVVLYGGESEERPLSLVSGRAVAEALLARGDEVAFLDPIEGVLPVEAEASMVEEPWTLPDPSWRLRVSEVLTSPVVLNEMRTADVVFQALHGGWGGDGHIQSLLDMAGVRYTGAPPAACMYALNKDVARLLLHDAGVPVAAAVSTTRGTDFELLRPVVAQMLRAGPVVAKPVRGGYSRDIRLLDDLADVNPSLDVLFETYLPGREFSLGVVGDDVLPILEIVVPGPLFDSKTKWHYTKPDEQICLAQISNDAADRLRLLALRAHHALGLGRHAYSRVDFREDRTGNPVCLEVNACPGLTPVSLLTHMAHATGWSYTDLISRIIQLALAKSPWIC